MAGRDASYSRFLQGGNDGDHEDALALSHRSDCPLPLANLVRLMRQVIPYNSNITDTAKGLLQDCVHEFASLIISEAAERCREHRRRIIFPENIVLAMQSLGFVDFVKLTTAYLRRRRQEAGSMGRAKRPDVAAPVVPPPQAGALGQQQTLSADELEMLAKVLGMPWDGDDTGASSSV